MKPHEKGIESLLNSFDEGIDGIFEEGKGLFENRKNFTFWDGLARIKDRLLYVQNPLSSIECADLIKSARELNAEPSNIDLFEDLHQQCRETLRYRGIHLENSDGTPSNTYIYLHTSFSDRLELHYHQEYPVDLLWITYSEGKQPNRSLLLTRFRGYHLKPENSPILMKDRAAFEKKMGEIGLEEGEAIARSELGQPNLDENPSNFLGFQPRSIVFHDGKDYKLHKY